MDVIVNRPNFLGSEVGLVLKTVTVPATASVEKVTENGRTIIKAGAYFTSPYKGLLFEDIDITDGAKVGSLMIGGYYIDKKLPTSVATHVDDLVKQGLFAIEEGEVTRPESFGDVEISVSED